MANVSLKKIAKIANVTEAAVSMALRDNPTISLDRRRQIKQLAEEMGYKPNLLARGLTGGRTHSLGILWSLCGPHNSLDLVRILAMKAMKQGYTASIADSLNDETMILRSLDDFSRRRMDGVVLQLTDPSEAILEKLTEFRAVVLVAPHPLECKFDLIFQDRFDAIGKIVEHMAKTGRKRPAFMIRASAMNQEKIQTFLDQFGRQGLNVTPDRIVDIGREAIEDRPSLENTLNRCFPEAVPDLDCLLCSTDETAAGAIQWLENKGLKVPRDVAVVGFNNSTFAQYSRPPIASVDRQDKVLAQKINELLFARLDNPDWPQQQVTVPMQFVCRESAG